MIDVVNDPRWLRYKSLLLTAPRFDFQLDVSRMDFTDQWLDGFQGVFDKAVKDMADLENGVIANPDEVRMVGHYWLRDPSVSPSRTVQKQIAAMRKDVPAFARDVLSGKVAGQKGTFRHVLLIGIGGSALGPQFMDHALKPGKGLAAHFLDNTDPDGIDRTLAELKDELGRTLVIVVSKSGGTKETRNGMLEAQAAYARAKLSFARHAVCVTEVGSKLDRLAKEEGWIRGFPMWEWVGGRTSVTSAVGLLPMALAGHDTEAFLAGAREMDEWTRTPELRGNPAGLLAAMWHRAGQGKGKKAMVVLPYKDRLEPFSRYLQQLVMESLGKERDLLGNVVNQGLTVYGNKGSTDQHAYVQQLREGLADFFAVFVEVKRAREGASLEVEEGVTSGDYLEGFLLGTREALSEKGRGSITITVERVDEATLGRLVALFERAVGFYASMIEVNAYHQPGVEAGKKAAQEVIELKKRLRALILKTSRGRSALQAANLLGCPERTETVYKLLECMSANEDSGIVRRPRTRGVDSVFQRRKE